MKDEGGRMKAEKKEKRGEVYRQMTQMYADKAPPFTLHPSSFPSCLCGAIFLSSAVEASSALNDYQEHTGAWID